MAASNSFPLSSSYPKNEKLVRVSVEVSDAASWCCAFGILSLILVASVRDDQAVQDQSSSDLSGAVRGSKLLDRPCEEIYMVGEGETLHTISDKCGDPFIIERNPHIHDPDDVFPGLVIKINPHKKSRKDL